MTETALQHDLKQLGRKISALHHYFLQQEDEETAEKAKQLFKKLDKHEYGIAFCGHFSAGKSSMINRLMGENLLPSSPIPTSANLVKIKSGEEYAKVYFKEGNPRLYPAPYDFERVKSYCKDGDSIQSIEISHASNHLPSDACIMDTPGIDSTDDAHRLATESALHLADLIFYVMDYNHVQSELNFLFTKELTVAGKEVYLVINQIDKHRDEELSFADFKKSVKDSFAAWGVEPAEIFYTSLKDESQRNNQFQELQQFIMSKLEKREDLLPNTILTSLAKLVDEHTLFLEEKDRDTIDRLDEQLKRLSFEEQENLSHRLKKVNGEISLRMSLIEEKKKEFTEEVEKILKNAYLMPFETRALAESYLQSTQDDFKVGLFFSKQKTHQEREQRLEGFFADFKEKVNAQITWHMKEFLHRICKEEDIQEQQLIHQIQQYSVPVTKELLKNALKMGARVTGEYVLNYTGEVAELAKKEARRAVEHIQANFLEILQKKLQTELQSLEDEQKELKRLYTAYEQKRHILEQQTSSRMQMEQILHTEDALMDVEILKQEEEILDVMTEEIEKVVREEPIPHVLENSPFIESAASEDDEERIQAVIKRLEYSSSKLSSIPGFTKLSDLLAEKALRLKNQSFTVALFGAFSAGKSSFANSLLGNKLLPVSPNPTTAAINKIMPVDDNNKHGLAKVYLKTQEVLFEDVNRSLKVFDLSSGDFDEALVKIESILESSHRTDAYEKTHYSFLNAFYHGFPSYRDQLGEVLETDLESFKDFVANEEKSCLVELIEVHYDCELTRKGITLVDTPGADSINARHTGVAFDYIKNSDAILFVTYYNHAFSKADREFLIQLGRVKDTFEMDKMFFIVNAVDLANNEEEKKEVLEYVRGQLIQYGIRQPSLFPISSLLALKEKTDHIGTQKSGIVHFEKAFYSFIQHDLTDMAVDAALAEWERVLQQLRKFIQSASEDIEEKQVRMKELQAEQAKVEEEIQGKMALILAERLHQEIEELTFYIKQRVFYRFHDFFTEAFNPSVLKEDGRNLKVALKHALDDFLKSFGFDFSQEMRATTLRVERFLHRLLVDTHENLMKELRALNEELTFSSYQLGQFESLTFENGLDQLEREQFKKVLALFKNPKSFFEKNEKRLMQDALQKALEEPSDDYLAEEKMKLQDFYEKALEQEFRRLKEQMLGEANEYYEGMYATLRNEIPVEELKKLEQELQNFS